MPNKLVGGNFQTVHSKIDDENYNTDKIKGLEHLYSIPAGEHVKPKVAQKHEEEEDEEDRHVQEAAALQVSIYFTKFFLATSITSFKS